MDCEKCKVEFIYVELCPLHAAAPELLEACKQAATTLSRIAGEYSDAGAAYLGLDIEAAIAKAEGKRAKRIIKSSMINNA